MSQTPSRFAAWLSRRLGLRPAAAATGAAPRPWLAPPAGFAADTALLTDAGPVRDHNEDSLAALNVKPPNSGTERTALVVLADGMGGHQAGERASREAVQAALACYAARAGDATRLRLAAALQAANAAVYASSRSAAELRGMGTTLLLFALGDDGAQCAWVGDSRLYRWRDGRVEPLTRDDTLVADLVDAGVLKPNQVAAHPDRSVLTQAVGTHAAIPEPHISRPIDVAIDDRYLLCSDGVHDVVGIEALTEALGATSAAEAVTRIHSAALANRADDNLSIAVVRVCEPCPASNGLRRTVVEAEVIE